MKEDPWNKAAVLTAAVSITGAVLAFLLLQNQIFYNSVEKRPYFKIGLFEDNEKEISPRLIFETKFPGTYGESDNEFRISIRLRIKNVGLLPGFMDWFDELSLSIAKTGESPLLLNMSNLPANTVVIYPGEKSQGASLSFTTKAQDSVKFAELVSIFKEIADNKNPAIDLKLSSKIRYYALSDSDKRKEFFVRREDVYTPQNGFTTNSFQAN